MSSAGIVTSYAFVASASFYFVLQSALFLTSKVNKRKLSNRNLEFCEDFGLVTCELALKECNNCKSDRLITRTQEFSELRDPQSMSLLRELKENSVLGRNRIGFFVSRSQREKVREFIEEYLAKLLYGTTLDDTPISQICMNRECSSTDKKSSNATHVELKKFISCVCEEVIKISDTLDFSIAVEKSDEILPPFDPVTYEQLVATAVLNKIVKNFENRKDGTSSESNEVHVNELYNDNLDEEFDVNHNHLSDYIKTHYISLPDLLDKSDFVIDDEIEIRSISTHSTENAGYEDNWIIKNKKLRTDVDQGVSMLIPSPTNEILAKTLIGDKNVDELSDLSDLDDVEIDEIEEIEPKSYRSVVNINTKQLDHPKCRKAINNLKPVENNNLIDDEVKNVVSISPSTITLNDENDEELFNSLTNIGSKDNLSENIDEQFEKIFVNENSHAATAIENKDNSEEISSNDNVTTIKVDPDNNVEEENERYTSPLFRPILAAAIRPIKINDTFTQATSSPPSSLPSIPDDDSYKTLLHVANIVQNVPKSPVPKIDTIELNDNSNDPQKFLLDHLLPGSIAEREILKWANAPAIQNNPYSSEKLQKRLSEEHKSPTVMLGFEKIIDEMSNEEDERTDTSPQATSGENKIPSYLSDKIKQYKRDYYINDSQMNESIEKMNEDKNNNDNNVIELIPPNPIKPQSLDDTSLDSFTRIYTLSSQEMKLIKTPSVEENNLTQAESDDESVSRKTHVIEPELIDVLPSVKKLTPYILENLMSPVSDERKGSVIEPELIDAMPSVKKLTEPFMHDHSDSEDNGLKKGQAIEPELIDAMPSVKKLTEIYSPTIDENAIANFNVDSNKEAKTFEKYVYVNPVASITARTLPARVKHDLRKSYSTEEVIRHDYREASPDIQKGITRDSIAYYEKMCHD